jgi:CRP-like cAMP-binding protein
MSKGHDVLGQLDDSDIAWLAEAGRTRLVAEDEAIIHQDTPSGHLFILLRGKLSVEILGLGLINRLHPGDMLGEMSFVDDAPTSASVIATGGPALVLQLPKAALVAQIAADAGFGLRFYRAITIFLADRLRGLEHLRATTIPAEEGDQAAPPSARFIALLATLAAAPPVSAGP